MIRNLIIVGLVFTLGNLHLQAGGEVGTVTTSRRVYPVLIRNEAGPLLQIVVNVQPKKMCA